jgi:hypothetical protein
MMAPMQRGHGPDTRNAQADHAIGSFGGKFMLNDQGGQARDQQQERNAAKAVRTVMMMVAVMHVMAMPAVMSASMSVAAVAAFLEREFAAYTDIKFAHKSPWVCTAITDRKESIIIQSSKINHIHQIIIIPT